MTLRVTAKERIDFLITKYLDRRITAQEFDELMIWLTGLDSSQADQLEAPLQNLWKQALDTKASPQSGVDWETMYQKIIASDTPVVRLSPWKRFAAAAVFILVAGTGVFLYLNRGNAPVVATASPVFHDVAPGSTKAVLTLSDGSSITLDNSKTGTLARQGNTSVVQQNGGLQYSGSSTKEPLINKLSTGRGEQSPVLTLSDGTRVWLNAASSISYPVVFNGNSREVTITGEAYFEVAHNSAKPFHVNASGQTIEVLGTHFNVNAYADEGPVKTTLLEGSVKIGHDLLKPGEQYANGIVSPVNTMLAVAWKNGYFYFEAADLKTVMRQVGRWYDLDIVYEGKPGDRLYGGKLERTVPLSAILRFLAQGNIKYRQDGKTLIIE